MRFPMKPLLSLAVISLAWLPELAGALEVRFCIPSCAVQPAAEQRVFRTGNGPATVVNGVAKTTLVIPAGSTHSGTNVSGLPVTFTISATVTSEQSGSVQKINFNPTFLTGQANCSSTYLCPMEVIAVSDHPSGVDGGAYVLDFPTLKPETGYPANVYLLGSFTAPVGGVKPNGDWINLTGESSGLRSVVDGEATIPVVVDVQELNNDVVNTAPGTGPGNVGPSLPICSNKLNCRFAATAFKAGFYGNHTETVQQVCPADAPLDGQGRKQCLTRLKTRLSIETKNPNITVALPALWGTADTMDDLTGPSGVLVPVGEVNFRQLIIGHNSFLISANLKLDGDRTINPALEEVLFSVGPSGDANFSMSILPGRFKRFLNGKLFSFLGTVNGMGVVASFAQHPRDSKVWTFVAAVTGVDLTNVEPPPNEIPVGMAVGDARGTDVVTAKIFD